MKNKLLLIIAMILLVNVISVLGIDSIVCVPTNVAQGGSISCEVDLAGGASEKNELENMTFYNDTAQTVQITGCSFQGTTENSPDPENLLHTCNIPSDWENTSIAVVNFSLPNLGTSLVFNFSILPTTSSQLIIDEIVLEEPILMGKLTGVRWTVTKSDTGKAIIGAKCNGDILQSISGKLIPIAGSTGGFNPIISKFAGHALTSFTPNPNMVEEDTTYIVEVRCDCLPSATACINEDGEQVTNSSTGGLIGIGTRTIRIDRWLNVKTLTDSNTYQMKNEIFICANVTNVNSSSRVPMEIFHQLRCSKGDDNDEDLDRALIISDDQKPDERGIDFNTTQMQCKRFVIPESTYLEGRINECYASTDVVVLDERSQGIIGYHTISPRINITSDTLNIIPTWVRVSDYEFNTIIDLNTPLYQDYDGNGTGNIDILINNFAESVDSVLQTSKKIIQIEDIINTQFIKSVTATNITKENVTTALEITNDGSIEIELRNVDLSKAGYYNVTMFLNSFEERQTEALEGINSSAGTFDFSINAFDTDTFIVRVAGQGKTGTGKELNRDLNVKCQVDGHPETLTEFKVFSTSTFSFTKDIDTSLPNGIYTMSCTAIDRFFGEDAVQATDNFKKFSDTPSLSSGAQKSIVEAIFGGVGDSLGKLVITGKDLIDDLFALINKFPVISLIVLVVIFALGREVYMGYKKRKKKDD